ncbi:hypothetical protein DPEC_G00344270 [Dallia pectoralis]|uniref:Uncharacterized protein n=1 Tax=Dallia pectoralis TaxID=75939 RepID=A0ACC2F380_DALPE|nr:hypothetical protein DPEC_G00344270 [Dallia pectoralis]
MSRRGVMNANGFPCRGNEASAILWDVAAAIVVGVAAAIDGGRGGGHRRGVAAAIDVGVAAAIDVGVAAAIDVGVAAAIDVGVAAAIDVGVAAAIDVGVAAAIDVGVAAAIDVGVAAAIVGGDALGALAGDRTFIVPCVLGVALSQRRPAASGPNHHGNAGIYLSLLHKSPIGATVKPELAGVEPGCDVMKWRHSSFAVPVLGDPVLVFMYGPELVLRPP